MRAGAGRWRRVMFCCEVPSLSLRQHRHRMLEVFRPLDYFNSLMVFYLLLCDVAEGGRRGAVCRCEEGFCSADGVH